MQNSSLGLPKLGMRNTRQRAAVVNALRHLDQFSSAKTIHETIREAGNNVGLTTVYRTLQSLAEISAVDALHMPNGETLYRNCMTESHHHHLVCTLCGTTIEIAGGPVEEWAKSVAKAHNFQLTGHDAEIYGLCPQCAKNNRRRDQETEN